MDLTLDEGELWKGIREGHQWTIKNPRSWASFLGWFHCGTTSKASRKSIGKRWTGPRPRIPTIRPEVFCETR